MYKIFLADDEIVVREGIRNSIDWDSTQYQFSGEAPDGEIALAMMQDIKPDILITDIRMPFMDGLTLCKTVKRTMPWIHIIILSGHDEFDYAKQAISMGVDEYMLKPIDSQELLNALEKVSKLIEERKRRNLNVEALLERLKSSEGLLRERFLNDALLGAIDENDILNKAKEAGVSLDGPCFLCVVLEFSVQEDNYHELLTARAAAEPLLQDRNDVYALFRSDDRLALLMMGTLDSLTDSAYELAQAIKYEVERNTKCHVSAGIGKVSENIGGIPITFSSAEHARKYLGGLSKSQIIGFDDINSKGYAVFPLENAPTLDRIKYSDIEDIPALVDSFMERTGGTRVQSMLLSYYVLMDILIAAARMISELGGQPREVLPEVEKPEEMARAVNSKEELRRTASDLLLRALTFRNLQGDSRYGSVIRTARNFIDEHYSEPDISLHSVARAAALSPNHFSTIFSQQSGQTFIEYLTKVRINKAKEMLSSTQMRAGDIANAVGYNEPHYFSYIFKKNVGMTPRDYRAQSEAKDERKEQ